ncbi:AraC family ligand binding domain-containing protein [Blastococcus sp. URHD0036]|uniref:AraC family ligand binding domain-containing protein n=1 Tax=Blastococcus sp. URHD0036 TaxID=1380356 RepID=UPI0009E075D3
MVDDPRWRSFRFLLHHRFLPSRARDAGRRAPASDAPEEHIHDAGDAGEPGSNGDVGHARPHSHDGGQLIVVVSGNGWVETAGERVWICPGDVVITPPDELHTHGAADDGPMAHLTVTTGGFKRPSQN